MHRPSTAVLIAILCAAPAAAAQTAADKLPATLNFGTGFVGSSASATPGSRPQYVIGADIPLSRLWSLRLEAGRRFPFSQRWQPDGTV